MTDAVTPPNPAGGTESSRSGAKPDPTLLTIDSIRREIAMLSTLMETKLAANEDITEIKALAHEAVHVQEALVRSEAADRIDMRLEQLNELRAEVIVDRGRFISREVFEAKYDELKALTAANKEQITEWKGQGKGLSMSASIAVGAVGFFSVVIGIFLALT